MISKHKQVNIKSILLGTIIVVIIGGLGIALNTSKSQTEITTAIAKEFGKNFYTVDAQKIADYKKMLIAGESSDVMDSIGEGGIVKKANKKAQDNYIKIMQSLGKDIQPLMTTKGYESIVANRLNTLGAEVCSTGNYTSEVTNITLDKNLYGVNEDKSGYHYEVKLKFVSTNGKNERTDTAKGYIGLLKENGQWKVWAYESETYPNLYKEILVNKL